MGLCANALELRTAKFVRTYKYLQSCANQYFFSFKMDEMAM